MADAIQDRLDRLEQKISDRLVQQDLSNRELFEIYKGRLEQARIASDFSSDRRVAEIENALRKAVEDEATIIRAEIDAVIAEEKRGLSHRFREVRNRMFAGTAVTAFVAASLTAALLLDIRIRAILGDDMVTQNQEGLSGMLVSAVPPLGQSSSTILPELQERVSRLSAADTALLHLSFALTQPERLLHGEGRDQVMATLEVLAGGITELSVKDDAPALLQEQTGVTILASAAALYDAEGDYGSVLESVSPFTNTAVFSGFVADETSAALLVTALVASLVEQAGEARFRPLSKLVRQLTADQTPDGGALHSAYRVLHDYAGTIRPSGTDIAPDIEWVEDDLVGRLEEWSQYGNDPSALGQIADALHRYQAFSDPEAEMRREVVLAALARSME